MSDIKLACLLLVSFLSLNWLLWGFLSPSRGPSKGKGNLKVECGVAVGSWRTRVGRKGLAEIDRGVEIGDIEAGCGGSGQIRIHSSWREDQRQQKGKKRRGGWWVWEVINGPVLDSPKFLKRLEHWSFKWFYGDILPFLKVQNWIVPVMD